MKITFEVEMISSGILKGKLCSNDQRITREWHEKFYICGEDEKNQTVTLNDCNIIDYETNSFAFSI